MLFQTYVLVKTTGRWRKFDPYPVHLDEAKEVVAFVNGAIRGIRGASFAGHTHVCAMPVSWAFA